ncbi:MAG TPA: YfkD family protein [Pseudogracilibacillus sp.]|nr:YfkD family protein [Pseudogracilibacillus sp.]
MNKNWKIGFVPILLLMILLVNHSVDAADKDKKKEKDSFDLPKNVLPISKENTFPNVTENVEMMEPSEETKALLKTADINIENPELIAMLNETTINPSPIGIGYRASIYLGRMPLEYKSEDTSVIWDYNQVNENELNNIGGKDVQELQYYQNKEKEIKGALTNKISNTSIVKKMMLESSKQKTNLPLSFTTKIGRNTKLDNIYEVPEDKSGLLETYAPAINEKGKVIFGEVYVRLRGTSKEIEIKNVTKQGIGAWIPIQDHVALSFQLK